MRAPDSARRSTRSGPSTSGSTARRSAGTRPASGSGGGTSTRRS